MSGNSWEAEGGYWEGPGDRREPLSYEDTMALLRQLWMEWLADLRTSEPAKPPAPHMPDWESLVSDQQRRTTVETVVVHHWSADRRDAARERERIYLHCDTVADDTSVPVGYECSLPLNLIVVENAGLIHVNAIPTECPLCKRPFSGWELTQISQAASLNYVKRELATALPSQKKPVRPIDVVFDI